MGEMKLPDTEIFDELHSFQFTVNTKPCEALGELREALAPFCTAFTLPIRRSMDFYGKDGVGRILLIDDGFFSIRHAEHDYDLAYCFAPSIFGLIDGYGDFYQVKNRPRHIIRAETTCSGLEIPVPQFVQKMDELNMWHSVAKVLAHRLMVLSSREGENIGGTAYTRVRTMLMELWLYPEEARSSINIEQFIRQRTQLSRSIVMKIIADLRKGGYIEVVSGRLVNMKRLPASY